MDWRALGTAIGLAALGAAIGHAALFAADGIGAPVPLPAQMQDTAREVRRCMYCGWIESKREIVPGVADPHALQVYEYTVRMRDGSSSVFREELPVSWRLGERLIVIDGTP